MEAGIEACSNGSSVDDAVDGVDDVGAGWRKMTTRTRRLAVEACRRCECSTASRSTVATSESRTGAPLLIGDDERLIVAWP